MNCSKYQAFPVMNRPNRRWPSQQIVKAPAWCSVDLRDGNQSLEVPMTFEQKLKFFEFLVQTGFKEIEVGFPASSDTEFEFTRALIERNLIPKDVYIQVLMQSREHIIKRSFEALEGVERAIIHLYNSTSTLQRQVVFNKSKEEIKELAVSGAKQILELAKKYGRDRFIFEYSPESFSGTEPDYAVEVCNAVLDVWQPTKDRKVIINLPNTVEMSTPNVYADQIEYVCDHLNGRENVIVSLHAHNDRGTAVAGTELGLLAGADRVEGTLFGNGERTGNADILTIAMNLYSQGIDMGLDFSQIDRVISVYETLTRMNVHKRHPYAGELVYTAFSGSHQDAINKGLAKMKEKEAFWEVPYLPIDPMDVGRSYAPIIRINSQSGKGGVAYILEQNFGVIVPKAMQFDFSLYVTKESDSKSQELTPQDIYDLFKRTYINLESPLGLLTYDEHSNGGNGNGQQAQSKVTATLLDHGKEISVSGEGNGLIDGFCNALFNAFQLQFEIVNYSEHSLEYGTRSRAITYMQLSYKGKFYFGAGVSGSISKSSLKAIISAVNKILEKEEIK